MQNAPFRKNVGMIVLAVLIAALWACAQERDTMSAEPEPEASKLAAATPAPEHLGPVGLHAFPSKDAAATPAPEPLPAEASREEAAIPETAKGQALTSEALMALFSGQTHSGNTTEGTPFTVEYRPDGSMYGRVRKWRDSGNWAIEGDQFCRRWSRWRDGEKHCFTIRRDGESYAAIRENRVWSHFSPTK